MEEKSNSTTIILIIAVVIVVAIGIVMMMRKNTNETKTQTPEEMVVEESPEANAPTEMTEVADVTKLPETSGMEEAVVKTIEMEAGAFYYKPDVITVKKGERVKIVMKSVDMMHDFNIDELNVKSEIIKSGNTGTVEFVADKVGTYEFYCSVGEHRAKGQIGKLIVQ